MLARIGILNECFVQVKEMEIENSKKRKKVLTKLLWTVIL